MIAQGRLHGPYSDRKSHIHGVASLVRHSLGSFELPEQPESHVTDACHGENEKFSFWALA